MLANRTLLEIVRYMEVWDVLECRQVCGKWRTVCGKDEVWMALGDEFKGRIQPGEGIRHWFFRCYRSKSTLVSLSSTHFRLFNCLTSTIQEVPLASSTVYEATYCLFTDEGSLIMTGGGPLCQPSSTVLQIALDGTYKSLPRLIEPRRNHGAVLFQGCIYLFGGMGGGLTPLTFAEKLDIKSEAIEVLPDSSCSRFCFTPVCDTETIYLSGGWSDAILELFHPISKDYFVPKLFTSASPERSISVLKDEYLYVMYAQGTCTIDLRRLGSVWEPGIVLPPGEVSMSPLLVKSTVWLFLDNHPVAIALD